MAGGAGGGLGRGGMLTKVLAAKRAARSGAHTVIASGREPEVLLRLLAGEPIGSFLMAEHVPLAARKQWLADHLRSPWSSPLDAGAVQAITRDGKSLLPIGVHALDGTFDRGAVVSCIASRRHGNRPGPDELQRRGCATHSTHAKPRNRSAPWLRRRTRADPSGQSGPALTRHSTHAGPREADRGKVLSASGARLRTICRLGTEIVA